jgi:hypothetical protein
MPKQNDAVQQFTALRAALLSERATLEKRLQQLNAALGGGTIPAAPTSGSKKPSPVTKPVKSAKRGRPPGKPRNAANAMPIREAITKVTAKQPLSVREIVDAVKKIGYKFQSSNPVNSVGAYLYGAHGKKYFKRANGKFRAA